MFYGFFFILIIMISATGMGSPIKFYGIIQNLSQDIYLNCKQIS